MMGGFEVINQATNTVPVLPGFSGLCGYLQGRDSDGEVKASRRDCFTEAALAATAVVQAKCIETGCKFGAGNDQFGERDTGLDSWHWLGSFW
jgi:hypothetical protein